VRARRGGGADGDAQIHIWCSITYGIFFSAQSSGVHRSLGVATSFVRSLCLDTWDASQVIPMSLGGNERAAEELFGSADEHAAFVERCRSDPDGLPGTLGTLYASDKAAAYKDALAREVASCGNEVHSTVQADLEAPGAGPAAGPAAGTASAAAAT